MIHDDLSRKIIGCAMKVHTALGRGYKENFYQKALAIELNRQGLNYVREMEMVVYYEGIILGKKRVDFYVENEVLVELKAFSFLDASDVNQLINYLKAKSLPYDLLINFGSKSLEFKRVYNTSHRGNIKYDDKSKLNP
jgi:GxxExxY protein